MFDPKWGPAELDVLGAARPRVWATQGCVSRCLIASFFLRPVCTLCLSAPTTEMPHNSDALILGVHIPAWPVSGS